MAQVPVLVIDFGSQYTQLIARRVREQQVYCEILPCTADVAEIRSCEPRAIILSGGPASVFGQDAPTMSPEVFGLGVPVLGICYGMQLMSHLLGGSVEPAADREYGPARLEVLKAAAFLQTFDLGSHQDVWMSHGDRVESLPQGFEVIGRTPNSPFAAVADLSRNLFAVQFHPEVAHTPGGVDMLRSFLFDVAGCEPDWTPVSFVERTVADIQRQVGDDAQVICGLSGGVDSSVAAMLVHKAIGDRLTCIFVDNGLLRKNEAKRVVKMFGEHLKLKLVHVDASKAFLSELEGISDPEQKRKTIGRVFIEVFEKEAAKIDNVEFLVQGTLYPDVIESVSYKGPSAVIKSHHNVGGLPERMNLALIEPLRLLFKDEVREVGAAMGMEKQVLGRHPFPGPGLAVRCPGTIEEEKLEILREADAIMEQEIIAANLYDRIWQAFCVILPVRTVGVMGDERTYDYVVAVRAVDSRDGMTADWSRIPHDVLAKISTRIINEVRGCNRVCYDISSKPPSTIEWE